MSSQQNKLQKDRNQKILLELAALPGNNVCADCKARLPRWASSNLGIFICMNCASIHRKIGTHITKVKSLTMDDWSKDQIENMKAIGNIKSNAIYNPNELRNPPPPNLEDTERDSEIEQYIRGKYEYRKFIDRSALVASKLGPSRSAASVAPRSVPQSQINNSQASASSKAPVTTLNATSTPSSFSQSNPPSSSVTQLAQQSSTPIQPSPQTRSLTHPVPQIRQPEQKLSSGLGGVWDDINLLNNGSQNSSLPLQYQSTPSLSSQNQPQAPFVHGSIGSNGYPVGVTSAGTGINPYQPQPIGINPFSQQQSPSPFAAPSMASPFSSTSQISQSPNPGQPSYGHQYFGSPSGVTPSPQIPQSASAAFFQPQPQGSIQAQASISQNFMTPSPNQMMMSASTGQAQFLSPSPGQQPFLSHSPSQQLLSHSPQPTMQMQQPQTMQGQFMYQSPVSTQPSMQFGMMGQPTSGQSQFLGMTTMQMQQQLMLQRQQQQQQQQQAMFASPQQPVFGQMYSQGGYAPQGGQQQWGAM